MIGHAISAGKKSGCVGETEIGIGQTSAWRINTITPRTSAGVYFEVVTPAGQPLQPGSRGLIQFVTHYQHACSWMIVQRATDLFQVGCVFAKHYECQIALHYDFAFPVGLFLLFPVMAS